MAEKAKVQPNLGEGSVGKLLVNLAIPTIVAQLVNVIYNMVDRIYIGHIPETGDIALTGLGLCLPIVMLVMAFSMLVGAGGAPQAAIEMGKGNNDKAEKIMGNSVSLVVIISIVLTAILELSATGLLTVFGASERTMPYALSYFRIYVAGTIFVMLALGLNTFITTQGFANVAMKTVLIGAGLNIILDPVFIFVLKLGVQGAAYATIISQAISGIWILIFLLGSQTKLKLRRENLKLDSEVVKKTLLLGLAPFIMTSTESILNIAFNSSLSKYGGDLAVGAMTIASSIMQMLSLPVQGLAQGGQPIISFNYGAGKLDRVRRAYRLLLVASLAYTMTTWLLAMVFTRPVVCIFNNSSQELIDLSVWAARIYLAGVGIFGIQGVVQQTFVALGKAKQSLFIACLRKLILLIPLIYILPLFLSDKVFAVFLAEPIADIISVTVASILFVITVRKLEAPGQQSK